MGGEKRLATKRKWSVTGSPPRGRGKANILVDIEVAIGITPAWAGKSSLRILSIFAATDHPRVGGEKSISAPSWWPGTGSPPRGRGKAAFVVRFDSGIRITPA